MPVPFSFGAQYQFPDRFYIREPAHPLRFRFIHRPTLPSLHTHQENGHRPCFFYILPWISFFPWFFFFFPSLNHQPFTPADTHRGSTPPRTDNALRESFLHTPPARPPPHQKHPSSPTPPHSVTPFPLVPACAAASSLGEYQRSSCPGVSNEGQRDKPHVWKNTVSFLPAPALRYSGVRARPIVTTS